MIMIAAWIVLLITCAPAPPSNIERKLKAMTSNKACTVVIPSVLRNTTDKPTTMSTRNVTCSILSTPKPRVRRRSPKRSPIHCGTVITCVLSPMRRNFLLNTTRPMKIPSGEAMA